MKIYLVGGAVRDKLLQRPVKERDYVVVGATPEQMLAQGFRQVGKDFPVFLHPQTQEEYALARTERKSGHGYHGFTVYAAPDVTLEDDLARRDLTVNAMAESEEGELIDPYGGFTDLQDRYLRHVSPAFAEDPVRILRVARFAARYADYGFRVHPSTQQLMLTMVRDGEVNHLVAERVWQELAKALMETQPAVFIRVLRECGALAILFPELEALFGVPASIQWHPEIDTGEHTLMVLQRAVQLSPSARVRFAALLHDLGKGVTPIEKWPKHHGHDQQGVALVQAFSQRHRIPNDYRDLATLVSRYHILIHQCHELRADTVLEILEKTDAFRRPERFEEILIACQADAQGRLGSEDKPYPQAQFMRDAFEAANAVNIQPILDLGLSGEKIKEALRKERSKAIKSLMKNS